MTTPAERVTTMHLRRAQTLIVGGIEIFSEPLIKGMRDTETNEPIHAIMLEGKVYMEPEYFDRLVVEMENKS